MVAIGTAECFEHEVPHNVLVGWFDGAGEVVVILRSNRLPEASKLIRIPPPPLDEAGGSRA
jgi:hypothetical protein